ncbi:LVIVD repeat-containing protein [Parachryseolinea silvisoli]|uniref:hypothetical protein n=1 Tax=Parachryseolinea silvisoli TaxID=2873601 RepID=UPI002265AEB4|nr:hypothetical protein [Parachryseolinea silvisoli]MCD9018614.1 hypothetical protein [Parachryseolinea silvisoli]
MRLTNYPVTILLLFAGCLAACDNDGSSGTTPTGEGGSMARFTVHGNYLYTAVGEELTVIDIVRRDTLDAVYTLAIPADIETIHAQGDYLYLGAQTGMHIYSLENPDQPAFIFKYEHIRSCDPVVVRGNRAYVTLRSGNTCGGSSNNLEVIDIDDPHRPRLLKAYPLKAPRGLAVDGYLLFVCDESLKVFDVSSDIYPLLLTEVEIDRPYDVIASNGLATVTSAEGILQYRYLNGPELTKVSTIAVERP